MKHLKILNKDKKLAPLLQKQEAPQLSYDKNIYLSLLRAIVSQQLSVKAADTIYQRFLNLFPKKNPKPELLLKKTIDELKTAGLSKQKAGYLQNIAAFFITEKITHLKLKKLNDDEIIEFLTQIKGVGKWTVEMLLIFSLARENVFPVDDLGILNGMKSIYKLNHEGKELKIKCQHISKQWEPYRSYACLYIWSYKDKNL